MDEMQLSKWEVVQGAPDRVNYRASCMTPAFVKKMLKWQSTSTELNRFK